MIPSTLSAEAANSFQKIYEDEFGELLSEGEAQMLGRQLLGFFAILSRPNGDPAKSSADVHYQGGPANSERKCW